MQGYLDGFSHDLELCVYISQLTQELLVQALGGCQRLLCVRCVALAGEMCREVFTPLHALPPPAAHSLETHNLKTFCTTTEPNSSPTSEVCATMLLMHPLLTASQHNRNRRLAEQQNPVQLC